MPEFTTGIALGPAGGELGGNYPNPKLSTYRSLLRATARGQASGITAAGTFYVPLGGAIAALTGAAGGNPYAITLTAADWTATGYSTKLRLLVGCNVTDTAPAATFTFGLYPVSGWAGGTTVTTITLGTVIAGSTVTWTTPAANTVGSEVSSGDFAFPSDGVYMVAVVVSGGLTANSNPAFPYSIQVRNV